MTTKEELIEKRLRELRIMWKEELTNRSIIHRQAKALLIAKEIILKKRAYGK